MMTRRERALEIASSCRLPGNEFFDIIERHLREYAEEAVMREMEKSRHPTPCANSASNGNILHCDLCGKDFVGEHSCCVLKTVDETFRKAPTVEDALRAINAMTYVNMLDIPVFRQGLADLIAGRRDTDAAKSILGDTK